MEAIEVISGSKNPGIAAFFPALVEDSKKIGACAAGATFSLTHRSHSISFTRAQGIPKYKIGFGEGEGWESWGEIG